MPLTATEQQRLGLIRPELRSALVALMGAAAATYSFTTAVPLDGGTRTAEKQTALYLDSLAQGGGTELAYPVGEPGSSRHEYGAAFDLHIIRGGTGDDGAGSDRDYAQLAELAESFGLTAGYYWSHSDPFHFQLSEPLQVSIEAWAAMRRDRLVTIAAVAIGAGLIVAAVS